jgi:hypothetical protein
MGDEGALSALGFGEPDDWQAHRAVRVGQAGSGGVAA